MAGPVRHSLPDRLGFGLGAVGLIARTPPGYFVGHSRRHYAAYTRRIITGFSGVWLLFLAVACVLIIWL
jgi:hypothetical protein